MLKVIEPSAEPSRVVSGPTPLNVPKLLPLLLLPVCWLPSYLLGGEEAAPPLLFVLPIMLAAVSGRFAPALAVAALSGVLAGPLTPSDVDAGIAQPASDWLMRGGFFFMVAAAVVWLARLLRRASMTDALTGLPNRALLGEHLDVALARAQRTAGALALVYVDLDDFKLVNDDLGHATGDELLRQVATRLRRCCRAADVLARQGGDEFLLLLADHPDAGAARDAALATGERIRAALEPAFLLGGAELVISASVGVSVFPDDAEDAAKLHQHADSAMYRAKAEGGGGVASFEPAARAPLAELSAAARLRRAIDEDELELHWQPIVELRTLDLMGVEALVRWRHPQRGLVAPAEFIPLAEQTGVIDALGDWVVAEVCRQAGAWRAMGLEPGIGVNVSPRQLRRPDFADGLDALMTGAGVDRSKIVLELTESAWMLDNERSIRCLEELRERDMILAIDDFGAGYSSLGRLLELPAQVLKVDRQFLRGVPEDPRANAVLAAVQQLATACGCDVVVEGVETAAQRDHVTGLGCRLGQGFGLWRPMPTDDVTALLAERLLPSRRHGPAALSAA